MAEAVEAWIAEAAQFVSLLVTVLEPKFVAPETDCAGVSWLTFCIDLGFIFHWLAAAVVSSVPRRIIF